MDKLPGDYIAGFVDGEGCFALKFRRDVRHDRKNKPVYFYWDVEFAINLKADDREVLEKIMATLGCGKVHKENKRGLVRYSVQDNKDLLNKIIPFFEKHPLRAKKRLDFELWKEATGILANGQDSKKLEAIRDKMKLYKGGNRSNWKWL